MSDILDQTHLVNTNPGHNKEYNVYIVQNETFCNVKVEYGAIGSTLTVSHKGVYHSFKEAQNVAGKIINEKLAKGYVVKSSSAVDPDAVEKSDVSSPPNFERTSNPTEYINSPDWFMEEDPRGDRILLKYSNTVMMGLLGFDIIGNKVTLGGNLYKLFNNTQRVNLDGLLIDNHYFVSDIYYMENTDLREVSFRLRINLLERYLKSLPKNDIVKPVRRWGAPSTKRLMFELLQEEECRGVVFKHQDSNYKDNKVEGVFSYEFPKAYNATTIGNPIKIQRGILRSTMISRISTGNGIYLGQDGRKVQITNPF